MNTTRRRRTRYPGLSKPVSVRTDPETGQKTRVESPYWSGRFTHPATGKRVNLPLRTEDKADAWELFQEAQRRARLEARGLADPHEDQKQRPLGEHVTDWRDYLLHEAGCTPLYVGMKVSRVQRIIDACGFKLWTDISADKVLHYMAQLGALDGRDQQRAGAKTRAHYLQAIGQLTRWAVANGRASIDPLAHVAAVAKSKKRKADVRHDRRELDAAEVEWLLRTTRDEKRIRYGVAAEDRRRLYVMAMGSGMRSSEIRSVAWATLDLDGKQPTATVRAAYSKNGQARKVWLPAHIVTMLRAWRAERVNDPALTRVFRMPSASNVARMLRADMDAARLAWLNEAKTVQERMRRDESGILKYDDGAGCFADFHALRHTAASKAARNGATRHAMALQFGWQTVAMADRYAHASEDDAASVAEKLDQPEVEPVIIASRAG
jgi:integrase